MMRSMYSAVSGLKTHQTKMDVIGNNIANVNTVAFKSSRVTFSDVLYQTTSSASGTNDITGTGGVNAKQIGLGVSTAATKIDITSEGASETTGDALDMKISGDAFFIVSNGSSNYFTRDGSFYIDGNGNLCMSSTGYNVMGWQTQVNADTGEIEIVRDTVSALQPMTAASLVSPPEATANATASGIIDSNTDSLASDGYVLNLNFYDALGYSYTAKFSVTSTGTDGVFNIALTDILDSNGVSIGADLATAFNGTAANAATQLVYDQTSGTLTNTGTAGLTTLTLNLDALGIDSFTTDITIDFSGTYNYDNDGTSTLGLDRGDTSGNNAGCTVGSMIGLSVQNDGKIYGSYDNNRTILLGQIATTTFANASGLESMGNNCYAATLNSGEFDGIGEDVTASGGSITTGVLEMSNVDLSSEFTSMITTQRGFQANSRIITVSDTLLEELTNLKR